MHSNRPFGPCLMGSLQSRAIGLEDFEILYYKKLKPMKYQLCPSLGLARLVYQKCRRKLPIEGIGALCSHKSSCPVKSGRAGAKVSKYNRYSWELILFHYSLYLNRVIFLPFVCPSLPFSLYLGLSCFISLYPPLSRLPLPLSFCSFSYFCFYVCLSVLMCFVFSFSLFF